jgi:hypothetical protein
MTKATNHVLILKPLLMMYNVLFLRAKVLVSENSVKSQCHFTLPRYIFLLVLFILRIFKVGSISKPSILNNHVLFSVSYLKITVLEKMILIYTCLFQLSTVVPLTYRSSFSSCSLLKHLIVKRKNTTTTNRVPRSPKFPW